MTLHSNFRNLSVAAISLSGALLFNGCRSSSSTAGRDLDPNEAAQIEKIVEEGLAKIQKERDERAAQAPQDEREAILRNEELQRAQVTRELLRATIEDIDLGSPLSREDQRVKFDLSTLGSNSSVLNLSSYPNLSFGQVAAAEPAVVAPVDISPSVPVNKTIAPSKPSVPQQVRELNDAGIKLIKAGDTDSGIKKLEQALALEPDNTAILYNLAGIQVVTGNRESALKNMERAVQLQPKDESLLSRLGDIYISNGDLDRATATFQQLVSLEPSNDQALLRLGTLYAMRKDFRAAEVVLTKADQINKDDPIIMHNLAAVLIAQHKFERGILILEKVDKVQPSVDSATNLGIAFEASGNNAGALPHYERARLLGSKDPLLDRKIQALKSTFQTKIP